MTKFFFATNYEMFNVHFINDVMNYTFLNKILKIEIVLQNLYIFMFIISSTLKKINRKNFFLLILTLKRNY